MKVVVGAGFASTFLVLLYLFYLMSTEVAPSVARYEAVADLVKENYQSVSEVLVTKNIDNDENLGEKEVRVTIVVSFNPEEDRDRAEEMAERTAEWAREKTAGLGGYRYLLVSVEKRRREGILYAIADEKFRFLLPVEAESTSE